MSNECSKFLSGPPEETSWFKSGLASLGSASRAVLLGATALVSVCTAGPASAQQQPATPQQPNILFIMGDAIGWMQPSIYHEGIAVGETPNIDRIGHEGAKFMTITPTSCTAERQLHHRHAASSRRHGSAGIPGARPTCGQAHPSSPSSCSILATRQASWARTILAIPPSPYRPRTGSRILGDLYHLDAMQQVASPTSTSPRRSRRSHRPAKTRRSRACLRFRAPSTPRPQLA